MSPARTARRERFDLSWLAAMARLDASRLTPAVRADLDSLKQRIVASMAELDSGTGTLASQAAAAVNTLRMGLGNCFTFYDGYGPLFTWWMGLPYKRVDDALRSYALYLRDSAGVNITTSTIAAAPLGVAAAPVGKFADVTDLNVIIGLSQDEMSAIVARFNGPVVVAAVAV